MNKLYLLIWMSAFITTFATAQSYHNSIADMPAMVRIYLDSAEYYRCQTQYDKSFFYTKKAQNEYLKLNKKYEAAKLQVQLSILYSDASIQWDSFQQDFKAFRQLVFSNQYPDLYKDYYLTCLAIFKESPDSVQLYTQQLKKVLKPHQDGVYWIALYTYLNSSKVYKDTYELATWQYIEPILKHPNPKILHLQSFVNHRLMLAILDYSNAAYNADDLEKAEFYCTQLLEFLPKQYALDSSAYSAVYNRMGSIYDFKEDLFKCREYKQMAIRYLAANEKNLLGIYNKYIGGSYISERNYKKAIQHFKIGLQALRQYPLDEGYTAKTRLGCLTELLYCYVQIDDNQQATIYRDSLLMLYQQYPQFIYYARQAVLALGEYELYHHNFETAARYFNQAKELYIQQYGKQDTFCASCVNRLAKLQQQKGNYLAALTLYQPLIKEDCDSTYQPNNIFQNPVIQQIKPAWQKSTLLFLIEKLTCLYHLLQDSDIAKNEQQHYIKAYQQTAKLGVDLLRTMTQSIERENSKTVLLETAFKIYEHAIYANYLLYLQTQQPSYLQLIFEDMEKSKSILLTDALQEKNARQFGGIPTHLIELETKLSTNIQYYTNQIYAAQQTRNSLKEQQNTQYLFLFRKELDSLKTVFKEQYPKYYQLKYQEQASLKLSEVQQELDSKTALLSYFEGYEQFFILYISRSQIALKCVPKEENYARIARDFKNNLTNLQAANKELNQRMQQFVELSSYFYGHFIPNIEPNIQRLVIIPDGSLSYFPFEVFLQSSNATKDYASMDYLFRKYKINYNYSVAFWKKHLHIQHKNNPNILGIAASYTDVIAKQKQDDYLQQVRANLAPLVGVQEEIKLLEQQYAGLFLYKEVATEAQFKQYAKNYGIIHLAMHGLVNEEAPEYSSLAFTASNDTLEDDFLYAYEIKTLALNAELVVLSACETGFGKYNRGEGVVSIGRGFMYAEVPSLVMTLWSINDQTTPQIMNYFYNNLTKGMAKDEALRQAKLEYLSNHKGLTAHPALWAAFVQVGNYDTIQPTPATNIWWYIYYLLAGFTALSFIIFIRSFFIKK